MEKKFYIQPQTDFARMANGEIVMAPIDGGLPSSGSASEPGKSAPLRKFSGESLGLKYLI